MATPAEQRRELESLQLLKEEWCRRLSAAAEQWVQAKAGGALPDELADIELYMQKAERQWRRYDRRLRRRRVR